MDRKKIIELLDPVIIDYIDKAMHGRYYKTGGDSFKLRISYCNALSRLLSVYNQISKDIELEELSERLDELEKEQKYWRR